jgi:hypothetical protein
VQTRRDFIKKGLVAVPGFVIATRSWGAITEFSLPSMDLDFIQSKMKLVRRWEWARTPLKTQLLKDAGTYDRLTVHHSGSVVEDASDQPVAEHLEGIVAGHIERGYGDVGYHFMIDRSGCVWEGRSLTHEGAHVFGQNERNIGVMLLGNFEKQQPTQKQTASLEEIVPLLCERYRIKRQRVYGHCDLSPSICPGRNLYSYVVKLRG